MLCRWVLVWLQQMIDSLQNNVLIEKKILLTMKQLIIVVKTVSEVQGDIFELFASSD